MKFKSEFTVIYPPAELCRQVDLPYEFIDEDGVPSWCVKTITGEAKDPTLSMEKMKKKFESNRYGFILNSLTF